MEPGEIIMEAAGVVAVLAVLVPIGLWIAHRVRLMLDAQRRDREQLHIAVKDLSSTIEHLGEVMGSSAEVKDTAEEMPTGVLLTLVTLRSLVELLTLQVATLQGEHAELHQAYEDLREAYEAQSNRAQ